MSESTFDESSFDVLLSRCRKSAKKLELRDSYLTSDPPYVEWKSTGQINGARAYREWIDMARAAVARGVVMRRVRVISEPVSQYIQFEHAVTDSVNIGPGEFVRWLPRHKASDLFLPINDVWIFDDQALSVSYFSGEGDYAGDELIEDTRIVKQCVSAFDQAWDRGIDHQDYRLA